uniref:glyoxylate/succinic semialdehyde reductase 1-like isoform X1 n=1 Tax=Styela clava TaxID=7725 RepID=UPI00193A3131|nr:glyoxylate/succinic semialdehyde reductase 1-like isoform X1 [Styela clava]
MTTLKVGDFVWAKMTGYPYWPGKIVEEDKDVKKPKGKSEMHYVRFYGTGDHAWTKVELIKPYEENKETFSVANKRPNFIDAVKEIEHASERRGKGIPDTSSEEEESEDENGSDDEPLSKHAKITSKKAEKTTKSTPKRRKQPKKQNYPSREQLTLHHHDLSHYLLTRSLENNTPQNAAHKPSSYNRFSSDTPDIKLPSSRRSPDTTADADSTTHYIPREVMATDKKIGFIGLGIMGSSMARNLVETGHDVTVWNRTQDKCTSVIKAGAKQGSSPADVVQQCDIIFSCVADPNAVRDIVIGNYGVLQGMSSGKGFVDMSTIDVDTVKEIAEAICMRGGRYLEAPVNGSKKEAEHGQLVILAAGDRSLYMDCYSSFEAMGKKTFFLGELGNGAKNKIIMSMMMGSFMASISESLSLAEKAGLDQYTLLEILNMGALSCPLVKSKGAAVLEGHFPANFPLRHMQKDLRLGLQIGEELEQPLHIAGASNELYKRSKAMGYGDRDMACVYRAVNA